MIKTVLSNEEHPEFGSVRLEFPIPDEMYDHAVAQLNGIGIGDALTQDCKISELDSWYSVLEPLVGTTANMDELDYLAKRLESFVDYEAAQFQGMAAKHGTSDIKGFINMTFNCQGATVIKNFTDLEQVGRTHCMTLSGGSMSLEEYNNLDGETEAVKLIQNEIGTNTPYGVVYDNGIKMHQVYDGQHFPPYLYKPNLMEIEVKPQAGGSGMSDYLYFPMPDQQLARTLQRAGATDSFSERMEVDIDDLPSSVSNALHMDRESLAEVNEMCQAIDKFSTAELKKLDAAVLLAQPKDSNEIRRLAENLDLFDFIPDVRTPEDLGRYMIQESGRFEYDPNLEEFYDYKAYAEQKIDAENGQLNIRGYISYQGTISLDELIAEDTAEQYQKEQELQLGGMA